MAIPDDIRRMLVERCGSRRTRKSTFTAEAPTEWRPRTLLDPRNLRSCFTDDSAWEFAAQMFATLPDVDAVVLDNPPGKKAWAWALVADGVDGVRIYVKLQLRSEDVLGRSFHTGKPHS